MLLTKRISLKIAVIIGIVGFISMTALFFTVNHFLTKILVNKSIEDMNVIVRDRAELIETYIKGCCDYIDGFSKTSEVIEIFKKRDDPKYLEKIRQATVNYAKQNPALEGLYVADWDTFVLAHNNPDSCGKTFRTKDSAKILEQLVRENGKGFCTGIVVAPITKQLVIPVYAPIIDENGEAVGFAGAAFYTNELSQKLSSLSNINTKYSLINTSDNVYIFSDEFSLSGTVCQDQHLLDAVNIFKNYGKQNSSLSYTTKDYVVSCYYLGSRGWVFSLAMLKSSVFSIVENTSKILLIVCFFITLLMTFITSGSVNYQMLPIQTINEHLNKLKASNYSPDSSLKKLCKKEDELGMIAKSVSDLHFVLENQYELFHEILESQTVGTLVTNAADNEIIMINKMAVKIYGFTPEQKDTIKLSDIQALFDEKETEKIKEVRELSKLTKEEIVYETTVNQPCGKKLHLLSHAKSIKMPNGETAVIFSFIDITTRKRLEENLITLSETDSLTAINNRRSGEYKVKKAILESEKGMFCLFDANKFKYINDTFGHTAGDKVLIEIANCMKKSFRTTDILIRLGGDEFVVFAPEIKNQSTGKIILERFMRNIEKINIPELHDHKISISLGAVIIDNNETFEQMYTKADSLMYDCKKQGGNAFKFYKM